MKATQELLEQISEVLTYAVKIRNAELIDSLSKAYQRVACAMNSTKGE